MSARGKTRPDRLFGAACLKLTLEGSGTEARASSIYQETLSELDLAEAEVDAYLDAHRAEVVKALAQGRRNRENS
ncbi:MAG: hypothetical protein HY791_04470 [Deltaproteobacteria bacterium]|nr:hypothetical protein [Deltaproteobacteria bacterium]